MTSGAAAGLVASIRRRQSEGRMPVLAEIKVRSPKEGDLLRGRTPEDLARVYGSLPVAGVSVVTEPEDFGGDLDIVRRIRPLLDVPILRKDFPRGPRDMRDSREAGVQIVLLTVNMLGDALGPLHGAAHAEGLETLVEVHDAGDLAVIAELGLRPDVLGVNNRDIRIGETDDGDVSRTERLAAALPAGAVVLSESAISGPGDARRARDAGADAVLVGTAVLTAPDTRAMVESLIAVGWPAVL
jgi:indole-3-glycerol phosphate synthase